MPQAYRVAALAFLLIAVLAAFLYGNRATIRETLSHWTGEEDPVEQIKGTIALALMRLTRHPPETDPFVPIAHTGLSPYGVNTFLEQEADPDQVDRSLRLIAEAGFSWIRQEFPWEDIEIAGKGDYWDPKWDRSTWAKYDGIVDMAEKHGLEIIARLDNPPAWSREVGNAEGWSMAPPDDYADYGDFVYAVVSRYKGRIRYYQIWNEPNIFPEWGDQPPDPAAYVELLKIAYRRAKEADPDCVIIAAGLAQTTEETPLEFGPRNMSDLLYLEEMYQAGAKGYFDVVSRQHTNFSRAQLLREIMVRHGDGDKPIWATEVGWNAVPEGFSQPAIYGRVSEERQAIYSVEAYERAAREWPWMGMMNYWFFRRPSDAEVNQTWYYFRMIEPDFTPLPVYEAPLPVYEALSELANRPAAVHIGFHQEDHWALNYQGPWQRLTDENAVLGGYALGGENAQLAFCFEGTDLALVLREPSQIERLTVIVDGEIMRPRHRSSAPNRDVPTVTVAHHLVDGPHQVHLYVQKDAVALDGLIVWRSKTAWGAWGIAFMGFAATICVSYVRYRRKRRP
jgi:hypothetical protein